MFKFFYNLFIGCNHDYKIISENHVDEDVSSHLDNYTRYNKRKHLLLHCSKCGKLTKQKV